MTILTKITKRLIIILIKKGLWVIYQMINFSFCDHDIKIAYFLVINYIK